MDERTRDLLDLSAVSVPAGFQDDGAEESERYLNRLNQALLAEIQAGGEFYVSNAVVDGRYLLRACIVNFRTSQDDIDAIPELVAGIGRRLHRDMQGGRRQ